jgi:hypothetical protein
MLARTLKTTALAAAVVIATAGASMAATWAWVDKDSKVRADHHLASEAVNQVWEGQKVQVIAKWNTWYKLKIPGPDGWVRRTVLDFDPPYKPYKPYKPGFGSSFCVDGKNAQFCLGFSN